MAAATVRGQEVDEAVVKREQDVLAGEVLPPVAPILVVRHVRLHRARAVKRQEAAATACNGGSEVRKVGRNRVVASSRGGVGNRPAEASIKQPALAEEGALAGALPVSWLMAATSDDVA